jgi:hypothetical protein
MAGRVIELVFDAAYLLCLWLLVIGLNRRLAGLKVIASHGARPLVLAFGLLAVGDTAHVGLRFLALAHGQLHDGWIGYGALATALTVTLFDLLLVQGHQRLARKTWGLLPRILLVLALVRLGLLALPQNHWAAVLPPQPWSLLRNVPLMLLTVGVGWLYLGTPGEPQRWQRWIGLLLLASALCHLPVALWIQTQPLLGLLMIPKSVAYLAMGWIVYRTLPSMAPISSR